MEESPKERPALGARRIRLVRFQRSEIDQRTRCEFTVAELDNIDLKYIAISYLWGDPTFVGHIECTQGPYFGRVWVLQELVMAPAVRDPKRADLDIGVSVQCNNLAISWNIFMVAIDGLLPLAFQLTHIHRIFKERPISPPPVLELAQDIANLRRTWLRKQRLTLLAALEQAARRQATLGSDKVSAVLNLVQHDATANALRPDYSISTGKVFTNTAAALLDGSHDFRALYHAGVGRPDRLPGPPSWVADWRYSVFLNSFGRTEVYQIAHFSASGNEHAISSRRHDLYHHWRGDAFCHQTHQREAVGRS